MKKVAIIGAGLSGLYAAYRLQHTCELTLFEARDRIGGRILTQDGFDMGPSWIWSHQERIISFVRSLDLQLFAQYDRGYALYDSPRGLERFIPPPSAPSGRMLGGLGQLVDALAASLPPTVIRLGEAVTSLHDSGNGVRLTTKRGTYDVDFILSTPPPRVALERITYTPLLGTSVVETLSSVPTWMGHSLKCVVEFQTPFWREMELSGFCFSNIGPLMEIHDACTYDRYALFGFAGSGSSPDTFEHDVREQMRRLFGERGEEIVSIRWVDWREEPFSSVLQDRQRLGTHPKYGFSVSAMEGKLLFAGTESAYEEGGYLEGAINSIDQILHLFR